MMTGELIERFFKKECSADEAATVIMFLKNNPAELEKYLSSEEWEIAEAVDMDDAFWKNAWSEIQQRKNLSNKIAWIKRAAVAAGLIFIIGAGYNYFFSAPSIKPALPIATILPKPEQKIILNNSAVMMKVSLPDSSHVALSPGSVLVYNIPFEVAKRDISLEGKARFNVMKDKSRPFTVFAGGLATTAVGTEFTINTREKQNNNITVRLHNGKVLIKPINSSSKIFKENIYLEPGQQLDYNESKLIVAVGTIKNESIVSSAKEATKPARRIKASADTLNFVNASLPDVMNKLSSYYKIKIEFNEVEINRMNFTGTITKSDSLQVVLKVISQMNGLEMLQDNDQFTIKKLK